MRIFSCHDMSSNLINPMYYMWMNICVYLYVYKGIYNRRAISFKCLTHRYEPKDHYWDNDIITAILILFKYDHHTSSRRSESTSCYVWTHQQAYIFLLIHLYIILNSRLFTLFKCLTCRECLSRAVAFCQAVTKYDDLI